MFVKETDKTITYIPHYFGKEGHPTRGDKMGFVDWRGSEDKARFLVSKLTSAENERDSRRAATNAWFTKRCAEILTDGGKA